MKKKLICALLISAVICSAASCSGQAKEVKAADVTKAVLDEIPINSAVEQTKDNLEYSFSSLDTDKLKDYSYYVCASGAFPDEIAFFSFESEGDAKNAIPAVEERLGEQKDLYETYTPDEFYKLENAVISRSGAYVYYLVTSDNEKAENIVKGLIG